MLSSASDIGLESNIIEYLMALYRCYVKIHASYNEEGND